MASSSVERDRKGIDIRAGVVNGLRKKLDRLDRTRTFRGLVAGGMARTAAAQEVGISRSTAGVWMTEPILPSVAELIERAAVDQTPREELMQQLTEVRWLLHGHWDAEADFLSSWMQLRNAIDDGLLTVHEYALVCESMVTVAADVLARSACDARRCTDHEEHIYVLCYGEPTTVRSRDVSGWDMHEYRRTFDRGHMTYPITHYVGWTGQRPPIKRVYDHGRGSTAALVATVSGTTYEESVLKAFGRCPSCAGSLDYFAESTLRDHFSPLTYLDSLRQLQVEWHLQELAAEDDRAAKATLKQWIKENRPNPL